MGNVQAQQRSCLGLTLEYHLHDGANIALLMRLTGCLDSKPASMLTGSADDGEMMSGLLL